MGRCKNDEEPVKLSDSVNKIVESDKQTTNYTTNQKQRNGQTCRAQGQCKQSWGPRRRCRAAPREGGTLPCEACEKCTSIFKVNRNCPKPDISLRLSQSLNQCQ